MAFGELRLGFKLVQERPGLVQQMLASLVFQGIRRQSLDGDLAVEEGIVGAPHRAHAAAADLAFEAIALCQELQAEGLTIQRRSVPLVPSAAFALPALIIATGPLEDFLKTTVRVRAVSPRDPAG